MTDIVEILGTTVPVRTAVLAQLSALAEVVGCGAGGGKIHGQDGNCGERGASSCRIGSQCMCSTVRRWHGCGPWGAAQCAALLACHCDGIVALM